jgi:hypothetical protein
MSMNSPPHKERGIFLWPARDHDLLSDSAVWCMVQPFWLETYVPDTGPAAIVYRNKKQDRQYTYNVTLRRVPATLCCSRQALSITYSACVSVDFGTHHAMRTRRVVVWPARLYNIFPLYLINGTIFGKKVIKHRIVLIFPTTFFFWNIPHYK